MKLYELVIEIERVFNYNPHNFLCNHVSAEYYSPLSTMLLEYLPCADASPLFKGVGQHAICDLYDLHITMGGDEKIEGDYCSVLLRQAFITWLYTLDPDRTI